MTKQEIVEAVTLIVMSYPASFKDETAVKGMAEMWFRIFKDDNPKLVLLAIEKHITTSKWPPSIAEVREQMVSLEHPEIVPPDIAWSAVKDLLSCSGEYDNGEWKKLPPLIARTVETIGWHTLYELHCGSYRGNKEGMDRVNFMAIYEPAYQREKMSAMYPSELAIAVGKAQKILGSETQKLLDGARAKRLEHETLNERLLGISYE